MTPSDWPSDALALLDSLWAVDTHMGVIRRRLYVLLGRGVLPEEVRAAAMRPREKPPLAPSHVPMGAGTMAAAAAERAAVALLNAPRQVVRADNPVRLVTPGTYPARGFTMLGGRAR